MSLEKQTTQQKHQFRSYYCLECKQQKPCRLLSSERCCSCYYQQERENAQEYTNYQQVYQKKVAKRKENYQQLKLLWEYVGCPQCRSKEVDAYELYENSKLVCQPCLVKKEGGSSSPVSFSEQSQWYQKRWRISLGEWLNAYDCLPINANCARKWLKNKEHLKNCACLEEEVRETYELFTNSLKDAQQRLKNCACKKSEKIRVNSDYHTWCESCEKSIVVASKKRVIKNRNDPKFWGLKTKEKALCGECLNKLVAKMPISKKYTFNKYVKRGYWK